MSFMDQLKLSPRSSSPCRPSIRSPSQLRGPDRFRRPTPLTAMNLIRHLRLNKNLKPWEWRRFAWFQKLCRDKNSNGMKMSRQSLSLDGWQGIKCLKKWSTQPYLKQAVLAIRKCADASVNQTADVASLTACAHLNSNHRVSQYSPNSQWRSPMRRRLSPVSLRSSWERGPFKCLKSTMSMKK